MPKHKSSKKKNRTQDAKSKTQTSASLAYYRNIMLIFNDLYKNYSKGKLSAPNVLMIDKIEQLNRMHLDDPHSNGIPAICCFIIQNTLNTDHFTFLTTLKNWGLNVRFDRAINILLLSHALKSRQRESLNWIFTECEIKIPSSGNPMRDNDFKFDIEATQILDYIETNLGSPEANFYLDLIPKHHAEGNTVLHLAAVHNRADLFHKLAATGADINQPNLAGATPAMLGVSYEDSKIIDLLLSQEYGASIDLSIVSTARNSLFHYIILGKNIHILHFALRRLEQQELSFNELTMRDGSNIVHWTIDNAQCALIIELIKLIDVNAPTPDGNHLVVYAFINDEPDIGYHIANSCNMNLETATFTPDGKNIFQIVIEHNALQSFIWLIDEGYFDIQSLDNTGKPPLLLAAQTESILIVDELFESYNLTDLRHTAEDEGGKRFGHYLVKYNFFINIETLLSCNILDFDHKDIALLCGESHARIRDLCLNYIEEDAKRKKPKLKLRLSEIKQLQLLLPIYCADDINARTASIDGENPIHLAYQKCGLKYLHELQTKYAIDINKPNSQDETILSKLVKQKNLAAIIEFITLCHPLLNNLDSNKSNLIQLACEHDFTELVEWCLETQNTSITKARKDKFSALDITLIKRNTEILHKLWARLEPKQAAAYLSILKLKNEQRLLEFLEEQGLYNSEDSKEEEEKSVKSTIQPSIQAIEPQAKLDDPQSAILSTLEQKAPEVEISLTCDEQTLFNAVQNKDHDYFRNLKHFTEYSNLLHTHAHRLLEAAVRTQSYRLVYAILRVPELASQADFNNNYLLTIAATQGTKNIVEALLRLNDVALSLRSHDHPAKLAAISAGHTAIAQLLDEYIDANQEIQQIESHDTTDDDLTLTTTISESSRPSSTTSSMFHPHRSTSSLSNASTDRDCASPHDENMPRFIAAVPPQKDRQISMPIPKTTTSIDILEQSISELSINAMPFEALPKCFKNPSLFKTFQLISIIFNQADIDGFIYGSAHYKLYPGDLDILIPSCDIAINRKKINRLIDLLLDKGAILTSKDRHIGCYGYNYEGRHVIPLELQGTAIEIVVYTNSLNEHAYNLDFTRSARYLSVRNWNYIAIPGIYANIDIFHNRIQTVINAHISFEKDPRRIFRAVKQMVDASDTLSPECYQAIQDIFYGPKNPFITHITIGKLYHRMEVLLQSEKPSLYFEALNNLGIFTKLYECFTLHNDYSAAYYRNILEPYQRLFQFRSEQQQMQLASQSQYTMYSCYQAADEAPLSYLQQGNGMGY